MPPPPLSSDKERGGEKRLRVRQRVMNGKSVTIHAAADKRRMQPIITHDLIPSRHRTQRLDSHLQSLPLISHCFYLLLPFDRFFVTRIINIIGNKCGRGLWLAGTARKIECAFTCRRRGSSRSPVVISTS